MKNFIYHDFKKLNRVEIDGKRHYQTELGNYPSVTTITGQLSKDGILEWRKRVGEEEANRISARASTRGTAIHQLCEDYITHGKAEPNMFHSEMFNSMVPFLDKIDNIHALESPLYSHHLQVAGTVDCIADYEGKLSVIDFKTSSRVKLKEDIHGYFMQTAAYAVAFEELTKIPVNRLVIIMAVDNDYPIVFEERRDNWIKGFIQLREDYRNEQLIK